MTDLETQATHQARLVEGAMLYTALFLVVLLSFATLLLWSTSLPDPSPYLPEWQAANHAPEVALTPEGTDE